MTLVNAFLVRVANAVLSPLAGLPALAVVVACALGSALAVLGVMRFTSNQTALAVVKRRIHAALLEMRLYNDDLRALLRAQGEVLRHNLTYVGLSLVPLVITAVPLTLAIAQLQAWYGYAGLAPGVPTVVSASVDGRITGALPTLEATGADIVGPARYFPTLGEVTWQVVPRAGGAGQLRLTMPNGAVVEKSLQVAGTSHDTARRSPIREHANVVGQLLYPSEPPIDAATAVAAIQVPYPERSLSVLGQQTSWLYVYLLATFAFVLLLRKPLGVVI